MKGKNWAQADYETLQDMWGESSILYIAKTLGRSVNAVKLKASRLGLGAHIQSGPLISFCELLRAIGQEHNYSYLKMRLLRDGFPIKRKRVEKSRFLMVCIDDFWKWAGKNKDAINFANFERYALGAEPHWVQDKRRADYATAQYINKPWSKYDDSKLIRLLDAKIYGYAEISAALLRTEGAVKRRINTLGLAQRPIKAKPAPWSDEDVAILLSMRQKGSRYEEIGAALGRSALSCRGRMERIENPNSMKRCNRRGEEGEAT